MRSILMFLVVVGGIVTMHASNLKLPDAPNAPTTGGNSDVSIPGSAKALPAPDASESVVYMPDSVFHVYRDHNLFVTDHYHVLYVKTDTVFLTTQSPESHRKVMATNVLFR
ncbi:hypothetical protein [Chitinophaga caseinilytica]|uniref:Organic solvent tolerance-like N-terminal domain-containing protein n=1 Tax=Chitinophaga caseinilytica TaxID=2267521 RepID=A0ABZ2Z694_9BACT